MEVTKANLATYLAELTPSATPYPIEITETVASDWRSHATTGTVGNLIKTSTPSGVYLDLGLTVIPNSVTNMSYTFYNCISLTTVPIIPNSVTNMSYTFHNCTSLATAPIIPNRVTNMIDTFYGCTSLTTAPIIPSSVTDMSYTFRGCTSLTTAPIIPSSVNTLSYTFYNCISLTTVPIIPSSVTDMTYTFTRCTLLHTIQNFAVNVENCAMTNAFLNCPALANIYVTTLTESSWHLLHTNTGATGTNYTIYNPDGTVAGSGTVAGTSQVLTLYGKSDELVISANITPTLAKETATSQVQWHKSGLPYDDELMIFNAKNPDTVISNFITVNRAGEEFLGRSKDSYPIPTDAVLQYSFDEIKQLPDNPTGTLYKRDNDWTTVDGWTTGGATASIVENKLSILSSAITTVYILRGMTVTNKRIRVYTKRSNAGEVHLYGTIGGVFTLLGKRTIEADMYYTIDGYINGTTTNVQVYFIGLTSGNTAIVQTVYIGDGSYLEPVIDNSYSEAHAENHGVIPVDGVCGKAGYFNNSYMIAPRPALGDDITIYFWAKFDALATGAISQTILQSRTVHERGLNIYQALSVYRFIWRGDTYFFSGYTPPVNTWHHVCMKMNATTKVLKINGETKVTLTGTYGTTENLASTIWSGMGGTGGTPSGNPLTGALDGLKIVPRYTTDDEDIGEYKARANLPKFADIYDTYSTTEHRIGTWIDGKPIYRKVVNFGALPNNTLKTVAYNISNLGKTIRLYGIAEAATIVISLPYVAFIATDSVNLRQEGNTVTIETRTDRTAYTAIIFIEYTKTTD